MRVELADLQQWFWNALRVEPAQVEQWVRGSDRFSALARMEWYAQMSMGRHLDALASEFPALAALLGSTFHERMANYVRAYPSPHASLGNCGERLPEFLRAHELAAAATLAELEIARSRAFLAAEVSTESFEILGTLSPEAFAETRLELAPSLQLLSLDHDPTVSFRQYEEETAVEAPPLKPTHLAVWRHEDTLFHSVLAPAEALALDQAAQGQNLAEVCAAFGESEAAANAAFAAIAAWFNEGWIQRLQDN